jgi:hypothetical protein
MEREGREVGKEGRKGGRGEGEGERRRRRRRMGGWQGGVARERLREIHVDV